MAVAKIVLYSAVLVWGVWATAKLFERSPRNAREDVRFLGPGAIVIGMFGLVFHFTLAA